MSRRRFLFGLAGLAGAAALTAGYGRYVEPSWVQVDRVALPIPHLPPHLAGKRFAQISDLHIGAFFTIEQLADVFARIDTLGVDFVMLTGDFVTARVRERAAQTRARLAAADSLIEPLRQAPAPAFAVIGNHDLWGGVAPIEKMLAEAQVTLLRNRGVEVDAGLWLAGVDDIWSGRPDLRGALSASPTDAINMLMAHEPDYFDTVLAQDAPVAAQFSGHSHGGQVRLPSLHAGPGGLYSFAPIVPLYSERYPIGLHQTAGRWVYTNRGLGCWPVPYRINCPPEVTVFELQPL
jgi:hypothetical protein